MWFRNKLSSLAEVSLYFKLLRIYSKISPVKQSHKQYFRNMKLEARQSFETSENNYPAKQCYSPEEWILQTRCCGYVLFQVAKFPRILWKLEAYSRLYKCPPVSDIQSDMNKFTSQFLKAKSNYYPSVYDYVFRGGNT